MDLKETIKPGSLAEIISSHKSQPLNIIYELNYATNKYKYMSPEIIDVTGYTLDELNEIGFLNIVEKVLYSIQKKFQTRKLF